LKPTVLVLLFLLSLTFLGSPLLMNQVHAASSPNKGSAGPDGISVTTLPTSTSDDTDYNTACPGGLAGCSVPAGDGNSWSATIFSITYTGTVSITITDCCYEGDYYSLWMTTDPSGLTGWTPVGTTDQVFTGPELVAPTYDPYWTGTGTQYSSTTFNIPQSGTVLYAVRDELLNAMVNLLGSSCGGSDVVYDGCSATGISASGGWSPAGYAIAFAAAATSGCLDPSGSTSWPTVTFTDGSTADVSVTGGAPPGACASMTIEDLFGSQPAGTTAPSVSSPNYYDLSILGLTAGTANVCFTSSIVSSSTVMEYWNGNAWVSVATTFTSPNTICGNIPVTALATPSTPVLIASPTTVSSVPQFPGGSGLVVVAVSFGLLAVVARKRSLGQTSNTSTN